MDTPILYLDQNHLSNLARHPNRADVRPVRELLLARHVRLGISAFHMLETSHPGFKGRELLCEFVDACELAWGLRPEKIFRQEFEAAIALAHGAEPRPVAAFVDNFGQWADGRLPWWDLKNYAPFADTVARMLEKPELRQGLLKEALLGARQSDGMKGDAAVAKDPYISAIVTIDKEHPTFSGRSGMTFPREMPGRKVMEKVGGLDLLPAYGIDVIMHRRRLGDQSFVTKTNDVVDELHAIYAAYADVTVLDRGAFERFPKDKSFSPRATWSLSAVSELCSVGASSHSRQ